MNNVIKRRKTADYTQIYNYPVQQDLKDLGAIGLLTYIMSLPEDWIIYKTQLHTTFTRRTVESAWRLLTLKNYAIGFSAYVSGKKGRTYFYNVSDVPFSKEDFNQFLNDVAEELAKEGKTLVSPEAIKDSNYDIPEKFYTVQNVQYKLNSTKCTSTKEIKTKEIKTNKELLTIVNLQESPNSSEIDNYVKDTSDSINTIITDETQFRKVFTDTCNNFYNVFATGRWSKKQWTTLINKFVTETIAEKRYKNIPVSKMKGYAFKSIQMMTYRADVKQGKHSLIKNTSVQPFYDWLNN